jgi:hypothetical protein
VRRVPAPAALAAIVALSTALHALAGSNVSGPWISPDETVYALLGQSLYRHGSLTILGGPTPFYSLVVPVLVGPWLSIHDLGLGYALLKPFLAFVMSLAAVPVYFWARPASGRAWALAAAALTVAVPGVAYSGLVMSEVAFYPVLTLAAWTAARALVQPSRGRNAVLALCTAAALLTRLQALVLLPAAVSAVVLDAWFARSRGRMLRNAPVVAAVSVPTLVLLLVQALRGEPILGAYESTTASSYHVGGAARFILYHAGTLVLTTGVIPVCALLSLAAAAARGRLSDATARATTAVVVALASWLVVQVGIFASVHVGQLAERDLLCVVPSLFVCLALWLERAPLGGLRTRAVVAAVALAALVSVPLGTLVTYHALFDSITLAPLWRLEDATSTGALTAVVRGAAALACLAFVVVRRRVRWLVPAGLLALAIAGSVWSEREVIDEAHRTRLLLVGHAPRWIDAAAGGRSATYVYDGNRDWPAVWQALFWNRSIHHVALLGPTRLEGPAPQRRLDLRGSGRIDVRDPDVILPSSYTVAGEEVAETAQLIPGQEGLRRWRLRPPPRILTRTLGLQAGGDIYGHEQGTLIAYGCTRGTWLLTIIPKEPGVVRMLENGRPFRRYRFGPGEPKKGYVNLDLPARPRPGMRTCRLDVFPSGIVGTTRFGFAPQTPG